MKIILSACAVLFTAASLSYADKRHFAWTYEWMTMPAGMAEAEYYLTAESPLLAKANVNTWKHQFELEAGILQYWDVSVYQMFRQANRESGSTFEYDGFKVRTRVRIPELSVYAPNLLLYLEYIRDDDFSKPHVFEAKVIAAKELAGASLSYNQIVKYEAAGALSWEYAAGAAYAFSPSLSIGAESKGNFTSGKYYLGPTVTAASSSFWVALGVLAGLTSASDNLQARIILGIPLSPFTGPKRGTNE